MFREIIFVLVLIGTLTLLVTRVSDCLNKTGWHYGPFMDCFQIQVSALRRWNSWETVDPISDAKTLVTRLKSFEHTSPFLRLPAEFRIRCVGKRLGAYIDFNQYLGDPHKVWRDKDMQLRLGKEEPRGINGALSEDREKIFLTALSKGSVGRLLRHYANSDETILVVSTKDSKNKKIFAHFDLEGMQEALAPIAKACRF